MFKSSKKSGGERKAPSNERTKKQFYAYSSSNRYISKDNTPSRRERSKTINIDVPSVERTSIVERLTNYIVITLIIICLGYSTTLSTDSRLIVNKGKVVLTNRNSDEYAVSLKKILDKSITNKNKITINTDNISSELMAQFPEVAKVQIRLPLVGRRPVVNITTDEIALVIKAGGKTYGVGKSGKLLIESRDQLAIDDSTPVINDESGIESKVGDNILAKQDVDFILNLIYQFKAKNVALDSIILPKLAAEVQIKPKGVNYIVKFNMLTDYRVTIGQYFSLKKKLDSDSIVPSEYIDSRVEGRIYYK